MKTKLFLTVLLFVLFVKSQAQIKTKVFTLNLGEHTLNSLRDSVNSNSPAPARIPSRGSK